MAERLTIQTKDNDNVVVAVHDLPAGTKTESGVVTRNPIPQAHKIALVDIPAGGEIIRYGVVLGYAKNDIPAGSWINEHMLDLPESPALTDMPWGTDIKTPDQLPTPPRTTWMGYRNKVGPAGTRNLLGIVTTVQCAAGVVKVAVERIKKELLPKYPNVDGVVAITHPYGCGVAINAPLAYIPIRTITNVISHPNFGGEVLTICTAAAWRSTHPQRSCRSARFTISPLTQTLAVRSWWWVWAARSSPTTGCCLRRTSTRRTV